MVKNKRLDSKEGLNVGDVPFDKIIKGFLEVPPPKKKKSEETYKIRTLLEKIKHNDQKKSLAILRRYRKELSKTEDRLCEILKELSPLEKKRERIKKDIDALKHLVESIEMDKEEVLFRKFN